MFCCLYAVFEKKNFVNYYRNSGLSSIVLHGPLGEIQCKLLITPTSVKIGAGWKNFCALHHLSVEFSFDLFFEVKIERPSTHVKVLYNLDIF